MYDTMRAVTCHQIPTSSISQAWQQTDDIRNHMLYFLENHDEQRIASDFFAGSAEKGVPALIASVLMQQNPFMLYFGEEYGERGMDKEGFSGKDGRTTIFDYWSVDTLCRAASKTLTDEETRLFDLYKKLLDIARKEKAIAEGQFFDLMYANDHLNRQYVFLRKAGNDLLLVVVNFEDVPLSVDVHLPAHAFDYLQIPEKKMTATDLLSKQKCSLDFQKDGCITLSLGNRSGNIWKIKTK
jgi:glycosidase